MIGFKLNNLEKRFGTKEVFKDLNLTIEAGSFVSIVGPSGCGKSTLLRLIAGLDHATLGTIEFSENQHRKAFVFQEANLLAWRNVFENVQLPFELDKTLPKENAPARTEQALRDVYLEKNLLNYPHELSGGMKMRVSLARALVSEPQLLLLDEPFSALDDITREDLQTQLLELWKKKKFTVVFVTHSMREAVFLSQKVITLQKGSFVKEEVISFPERNQTLRTSLEYNQRVEQMQRKS